LQASIGREWVEAGACAGETAVYRLSEQHQAELNAFLDTFYSFTADTKAGRLTFNGSNRGLNAVPFPAQERMLAYWAWVVYEELLTGTSPTWNQVFVWQQAENGRCQQLHLMLTGIATALSCDNEELVELGWDMLGAEDLAQFYGWIDTFAVTNTADFILVGSGQEPIDPDHETAIDIFAQNQFARLVVNNAGVGETIVEPLANARYFTVAGWSVDSRWLAYWASTQADVDVQQPYTMPGGTLYFADTTTGKICAAEIFHTETDREAAVYWLPENEVVVVLPDGAFAGQPCRPFTPLPDYVPPLPDTTHDPALSPNDRYRASSINTTNEDWTLTVTTTIVDVQSGAEVVTLTWQHRGGLGDLGLGGMWVSSTQFLIHETLVEGPLIMDVEKGIIPALTGLPGLSLTPPDAEEEYSLWAMAAPGIEPDTFSLVISGVGSEAAFPPVVLYHAATGLAETLPFRHFWNFSPTYEWLFLYETVITGGYESGYHIWGRRLADVGGEWQLVAPAVDYLAWRDDGNEMTFIQNENRVIWQKFPVLERIGEWHTGPYWVNSVSFSPDGRFLVVQGNLPGTWQYGLFLLER
jgi:WD40 repeat protein